jgi:hypothetical protein
MTARTQGSVANDSKSRRPNACHGAQKRDRRDDQACRAYVTGLRPVRFAILARATARTFLDRNFLSPETSNTNNASSCARRQHLDSHFLTSHAQCSAVGCVISVSYTQRPPSFSWNDDTCTSSFSFRFDLEDLFGAGCLSQGVCYLPVLLSDLLTTTIALLRLAGTTC